MKKVMIFGTFDGIHEGHRFVFREAKKYGEYLIVVVARDKTVWNVKGRLPARDEEARQADAQKERRVDEAILGSPGDKYRILFSHKPDVICLGYDQNSFTDGLDTKLFEFGLKETKIVRLKAHRPERYKSSLLRNRQHKKGKK
jgi:FAD synthetase